MPAAPAVLELPLDDGATLQLAVIKGRLQLVITLPNGETITHWADTSAQRALSAMRIWTGDELVRIINGL